jgi:hypothetical protein
VASCCEHSNELSSSIQDGESVKLSDCQFLKKESAP